MRDVRRAVAHLVHVEAHAVDRLLEHHVLLLLLVQLRLRLLRDGELALDERDALLVVRLLPPPLRRLDLLQARRLLVVLYLFIPPPQRVPVPLRLCALFLVLLLQTLVRRAGRLQTLLQLRNLGLER